MEDEALRPLILDPFDYQGVDVHDASSVVLLPALRQQHRAASWDC